MRVFLSLFFFFFCLSICSYRKRNESKRKEGNQGEKKGDQFQVVRNAFPVFSATGFLRESKGVASMDGAGAAYGDRIYRLGMALLSFVFFFICRRER